MPVSSWMIIWVFRATRADVTVGRPENNEKCHEHKHDDFEDEHNDIELQHLLIEY